MKKILLSLLAIILIIEEWLWDLLSATGHRLIEALHLQSLEQRLSQASPAMALLAFCVPMLIVTPLNLIALNLLAHGLILQGISLEIIVKLLGTLLVSRVFSLTKPQLLSFGILNLVYTTIMFWLHWAHQRIVETATYRLVKQLQRQAKHSWQTWKTSLKGKN